MEWEPTYKERFPAWRSSDGALKEKSAKQPTEEGGEREAPKEAMPGYQSSEEEKKRRDEPRKIWELGNAYGSLAIGKKKNKQLMIVNSQRRTKDLRALTPESKELRRETSLKIPLISEEFRFNEDWNRREESAYSLQLDASRSPDYLMRKMKELGEKRKLDVRDNVNPFFNLNEDRDELAYLRSKAAEAAKSGDRKAEKGLASRVQYLGAALADKERQRLKLYTKLPDLLEEARKEDRDDRRATRAAAYIARDSADADEDEDDAGENVSEDEDMA